MANTQYGFSSREDVREEVGDVVNHPSHYTSHPSGIECIEVVEHMSFCLGSAVKYCWRCHEKHDDPIEDLRKAVWYLEREIKRLEKGDDKGLDANEPEVSRHPEQVQAKPDGQMLVVQTSVRRW